MFCAVVAETLALALLLLFVELAGLPLEPLPLAVVAVVVVVTAATVVVLLSFLLSFFSCCVCVFA